MAQRKDAGAGERTPEQALAEANTQTSNHPDPDGTETVRVLPGQAYEAGGNRYLEGNVFDLSTSDAKTAEKAEQVEIVGPPERRKY